MLDKFAIAAALQEIALLLEIKGEQRFKARAYKNASRSVASTNEDIGTLVRRDRLQELRGVGAAIASQIRELCQTGKSGVLDRLRRELPKAVIELSRVPGLSLRRIEQLEEGLGITTIEELKVACAKGNVRKLPGFGPKTEQKILSAIEGLGDESEPLLLVHALRLSEQLLDFLKQSKLAKKIIVAGDLRRSKEVVGQIRLVALAEGSATKLIDYFLRFPSIATVEKRAELSASARLAEPASVSLSVVNRDEYPLLLFKETGSEAHVQQMERLAVEKGLRLGPRGLQTDRDRFMKIRDEADIYSRMGMQFIPPELRENDGEIEAALRHEIPEDLVTVENIRGLVHCHTTFSDGAHSLLDMALAADAMGMKYITITDHSPTAFYARGVTLDNLKRQWEEIDRVQEKVSVRILRGTESDILANGALDYPANILEKFDVVIASIHARYSMDEEKMTRRIVTAMKQPIFKIWGHALGRLIGRRPPFACRVEEVLEAISESQAAIEINGDPYRLDMEPRWIKLARKRRIKFVISTDAHSVGALQNFRFGVMMARRGGVRKKEVLNSLTAPSFVRAVRPIG